METDLTPSEELRTLRAASGQSASWCAEHVARVTARSWQYWESGGKHGRPCRVPGDVLATMRRMAAAVQGVLAELDAGQAVYTSARRAARGGAPEKGCASSAP